MVIHIHSAGTTGTAAEISRNRDSRRASASAISIGVCSRAGMAA